MLKSAALALALALSLTVPAMAAPRNPECAPLSKIFRASVQARQKGTNKSDIEKLAGMIEDPSLKSQALAIVNKVYGDPIFASAPPATAATFYSASCR